jgi:hypothetical protein
MSLEYRQHDESNFLRRNGDRSITLVDVISISSSRGSDSESIITVDLVQA